MNIVLLLNWRINFIRDILWAIIKSPTISDEQFPPNKQLIQPNSTAWNVAARKSFEPGKESIAFSLRRGNHAEFFRPRPDATDYFALKAFALT